MAKAKTNAAQGKARTAKKEQTSVKTVTTERYVKVQEEKEPEPKPLKKGDMFLFIKNGREVYLTRHVAIVTLLRKSSDLVIPEGSPFVPPKEVCDEC